MSQFRWMNSRRRRLEFERMAHSSGYLLSRFTEITRLSDRQLERYFRDDFRCTPKQWIDQLRISAAQDQLRVEGSVKAVAYQMGFKSQSHFCAFFNATRG